MSSTDGEAGMRNLTDKATYERLEKDVTAVKNDIAALTEQITDALNSFAAIAAGLTWFRNGNFPRTGALALRAMSAIPEFFNVDDEW